MNRQDGNPILKRRIPGRGATGWHEATENKSKTRWWNPSWKRKYRENGRRRGRPLKIKYGQGFSLSAPFSRAVYAPVPLCSGFQYAAGVSEYKRRRVSARYKMQTDRADRRCDNIFSYTPRRATFPRAGPACVFSVQHRGKRRGARCWAHNPVYSSNGVTGDDPTLGGRRKWRSRAKLQRPKYGVNWPVISRCSEVRAVDSFYA